jgi:hypothetical protein
MLRTPRAELAVFLLHVPGERATQKIHALAISGLVSPVVAGDELSNLSGSLLVFGAVIRQPRKPCGLHEPLFRGEVFAGE